MKKMLSGMTKEIFDGTTIGPHPEPVEGRTLPIQRLPLAP
jgi:hypothetical protein